MFGRSFSPKSVKRSLLVVQWTSNPSVTQSCFFDIHVHNIRVVLEAEVAVELDLHRLHALHHWMNRCYHASWRRSASITKIWNIKKNKNQLIFINFWKSGKWIRTKRHTTTENNSEIFDSNNAAPAKNAIFPSNIWAIIATIIIPPPKNPFIFFFRPAKMPYWKSPIVGSNQKRY